MTPKQFERFAKNMRDMGATSASAEADGHAYSVTFAPATPARAPIAISRPPALGDEPPEETREVFRNRVRAQLG